jgi:predicted ATP-dependent endonuclease of OLD family
MKIDSIYIRNFRPIKEIEMEFSSLVILIGKNASGKSSIIQAIDYFFDESKKGINSEDFHYGNTDEPIIIKITFIDLLESEKELFKKYYNNGEMVVQKEIYYNNGNIKQKYHGFTRGIEEIEEIKNIIGKPEIRKKFNELAEKYEGLKKASKYEEVIKNISEFYEENTEKLQLVKSPFQFYGDARIGGGSLDNFTKFVFVPAVREASEDIDPQKGILNTLINALVKRKILSRKDIIDFKEEIEKQVKESFKPEKLPELSDLEVMISSSLKDFEPNAGIKLRWLEPKPFELDLPIVAAKVIDDEYEGDIEKKGHGLQRSVIFTLLKEMALSEGVIKSEVSFENETNKKESFENDLIICIEEPEIYQHPLKCRFLSEVFEKLTKQYGNRSRNQIIYTTHSPFFINISKFNNFIKVIKVKENDEFKSIINRLTISKAREIIAYIREIDIKEVTDEYIIKRVLTIMKTDINEGFFADKVVLLEGQSDLAVIREIAFRKDINLSGLGIALLQIGGKENFDIPCIIFQGIGIKTYLVFDNDKYDIKGEIEKKKANRKCLRLVGIDIEPCYPKQDIKYSYACFDGNLEIYLKNELGNDLFNEIEFLAKSETKAKDLKNILSMSYLINEVYDRGYKLDFIEKIIDKICQI